MPPKIIEFLGLTGSDRLRNESLPLPNIEINQGSYHTSPFDLSTRKPAPEGAGKKFDADF
ncbi:MAG: hypothetical protein LBK53_08010 [Heliobacteriaceae bacterium]|jgi:hypothetical protein|nr:hypothetical protein [Heliobacteriaceae bacterium]